MKRTQKEFRGKTFQKAETDPDNKCEKEVRWRKEERKTEREAQRGREAAGRQRRGQEGRNA